MVYVCTYINIEYLAILLVPRVGWSLSEPLQRFFGDLQPARGWKGDFESPGFKAENVTWFCITNSNVSRLNRYGTDMGMFSKQIEPPPMFPQIFIWDIFVLSTFGFIAKFEDDGHGVVLLVFRNTNLSPSWCQHQHHWKKSHRNPASVHKLYTYYLKWMVQEFLVLTVCFWLFPFINFEAFQLTQWVKCPEGKHAYYLKHVITEKTVHVVMLRIMNWPNMNNTCYW